MASTNSTVDGMGFEEINQVGNMPANMWITGSVTADAGIQTGGNISGAGEIYGDNIWGTSVNDSDGVLRSVSIENATELFDQRVKAGSIMMGNSWSGLVAFKTPFTTANYFLTCSARTYGAPQWNVAGSQGAGYGTSGTRRASGCWIVGGSATAVDWIAVGI